jgi:hypothetical protein
VAGDVIVAYAYLDHLTEMFNYYQQASSEHAILPESGYGRGLELLAGMQNAGDRFRTDIGPAVEWCEKAMDGLKRPAKDKQWKHWLAERPRLP